MAQIKDLTVDMAELDLLARQAMPVLLAESLECEAAKESAFEYVALKAYAMAYIMQKESYRVRKMLEAGKLPYSADEFLIYANIETLEK